MHEVIHKVTLYIIQYTSLYSQLLYIYRLLLHTVTLYSKNLHTVTVYRMLYTLTSEHYYDVIHNVTLNIKCNVIYNVIDYVIMFLYTLGCCII